MGGEANVAGTAREEDQEDVPSKVRARTPLFLPEVPERGKQRGKRGGEEDGGPRRKRRRTQKLWDAAAAFLDVEAAESEGSGDEDEEDEALLDAGEWLGSDVGATANDEDSVHRQQRDRGPTSNAVATSGVSGRNGTARARG